MILMASQTSIAPPPQATIKHFSATCKAAHVQFGCCASQIKHNLTDAMAFVFFVNEPHTPADGALAHKNDIMFCSNEPNSNLIASMWELGMKYPHLHNDHVHTFLLLISVCFCFFSCFFSLTYFKPGRLQCIGRHIFQVRPGYNKQINSSVLSCQPAV